VSLVSGGPSDLHPAGTPPRPPPYRLTSKRSGEDREAPAPSIKGALSMSIDLPTLGWDEAFAAAYRPHRRSGQQPGRISRTDRGVCTVFTANGAVRASIAGGLLSTAARDPLRLPAAGDWVVVRAWPDDRLTIEAVLPRRTTVARAGAGRDSLGQVLAANLDTAAVVEPVDPEPDAGRVERLLSLVWESGARPVLLLTKADRVPDPQAVAAEFASVAPGVPSHLLDGRDPASVSALRRYLAPGATLGLFGPSGAGKSTLVNTLAGASVMSIRTLRADGKGRHTTAYRSLVPVPGGGAVLDTPGLRSVGLYDGATGLTRTFADIADLAQHCHFDDCTHRAEPHCAVRLAVESGDLPPRRLTSYRKLLAEQSHQSTRHTNRTSHRWHPLPTGTTRPR
jgi:ribosome biogenesis GTPase